MKKTLFSITLLCLFFTISHGQQLLTEDFNSMTAGDLSIAPIVFATSTTGQNGWTLYSFMATPANSTCQVVSVGVGDNRFEYTGSPLPASTVSPTENTYVQQSIDWTSRTAGNDIIHAEYIFNTGASSVSKNEFIFGIYNTTRLKVLSGFKYVHDTKVLNGLAYDSTGTTTYGNYVYSTIGVGGTSLVLLDNTDYFIKVSYDVSNGEASWYVALNSSVSTPLCNGYTTNYITPDLSLLVMSAKAGTSNTTSSFVQYDDISVDARPCVKYTTTANSDFSYVADSHCIGTTNLTPVLVDLASTGTFSSTPTGLVIDPATGIVDLSAGGSSAGVYSVKFVADNACVDSTELSITILDCAGIEEVVENIFSVYPSPANDVVNVSLGDLVVDKGVIRLLSMDGKLIESREFNNSKVESFEVKSLNSGVYFIQIGSTTEKVIIQ